MQFLVITVLYIIGGIVFLFFLKKKQEMATELFSVEKCNQSDSLQPDKVLHGKWTIKNKLSSAAESAVGDIWSVCTQQTCQLVLKHVPLKDEKEWKEFQTEVSNQTACARHGLCPPVLDSWKCTCGAAMVMPKMSITVAQMLNKMEEQKIDQGVIICVFMKVFELIKRLHTEAQMVHGDLHLNNIMVKPSSLPNKQIDIVPKTNKEVNALQLVFIDLPSARCRKSFASDEDWNAAVKDDYMSLTFWINSVMSDPIGEAYDIAKAKNNSSLLQK